jgi:hypothetical protein
MLLEQLPLTRQVDIVFRKLKDELFHLRSGIIFMQIRNNTVGKFGIKHDPIETRDGQVREENTGKGLSEHQVHTFKQMAIQSLKYKHWTHGEISFEFALKHNTLMTSVQFESNYNMANMLLQADI